MLLTLLLSASAAPAAGLSIPGFGPAKPAKPHPAIEVLRELTAVLHTTAGDITISFYPDAAPNTVRNFVKLAQTGAFDGHRFQPVFKGKMVVAAGKGDDARTLPFEDTGEPHEAGTLAMDRVTPDPEPGKRVNSATRFFINLGEQDHLDGDYTVFARITDGLDVARRIGGARVKTADGQPVPLEDFVIESIVIRKETKEDAKEEKQD
jgi:cyclophilin family peptidyl-prolyl cis-trans isomerase